jgi:hypothetical protein
MAVGVGVLGTEHRPDFEHAFKVGADRHLLVELRRLGEISVACES